MDKRTTTTTSMVLLRRAMRALSLAAAACLAPLAAGCAAPTAREVLMNHYAGEPDAPSAPKRLVRLGAGYDTGH